VDQEPEECRGERELHGDSLDKKVGGRGSIEGASLVTFYRESHGLACLYKSLTVYTYFRQGGTVYQHIYRLFDASRVSATRGQAS
jgi:hypothetical protein